MGNSESQGGGDDFALPQQQIVTGRAAATAKGAGRGAAAAVKAKHSTTDRGMKMPLVWDKTTIFMERVGRPSAGTWRLAVEFTAEVPCELEVAVHCKEAKEGSFLAFQRVDLGGPPSITQTFEAGRHTVNLDGNKAIDLVHFALHRYWKYSEKQQDVVPIAMSLKSDEEGGCQAIMHLCLVVSKEEGGASCRPQFLRQKVVVQGKEYKLEEIFGIAELGKADAHDESEMGEPCVICLSEPRTTALLPCRHLCVCESCAVQLKLRKSPCPICRREVQDLQVFDVKGAPVQPSTGGS